MANEIGSMKPGDKCLCLIESGDFFEDVIASIEDVRVFFESSIYIAGENQIYLWSEARVHRLRERGQLIF